MINNSITEDFNVFYWRHVSNEIDFVLEYKNKIVGIEVKSTNIKAIKGIELFKRQFNPQKIIIISPSGFNWKEFLKMNPILLFD